MTEDSKINREQVIGHDTRQLPIKLTPDERAGYADRLAQIEPEQTALKVAKARMLERHKREKKDADEAIEKLDSERGSVAAGYREGVVLRPIKVEMVADYQTGTKCPRRVDTGEFLTSERKLLDDDEKQLHIVPQTEPSNVVPMNREEDPDADDDDDDWLVPTPTLDDEPETTLADPDTTAEQPTPVGLFGGAMKADDRRKYVRACDDSNELRSLLAVAEDEKIQGSVVKGIKDRLAALNDTPSE